MALIPVLVAVPILDQAVALIPVLVAAPILDRAVAHTPVPVAAPMLDRAAGPTVAPEDLVPLAPGAAILINGTAHPATASEKEKPSCNGATYHA